MQYSNLIELHELRAQEKAIKARINVISPAAEEEALALAPNGGQFTHEGLTFQLQLTDVIDFSDHHRYKASSGSIQELHQSPHRGDVRYRRLLPQNTPQLATRRGKKSGEMPVINDCLCSRKT